MKVARDFKRPRPGVQFSNEGYHCELSAEEFGLEGFAAESVAHNNLVYRFLAYVCTKRVMESAVRDGVIKQEDLTKAMENYTKEMEFESKVASWQQEAMEVVAKVVDK